MSQQLVDNPSILDDDNIWRRIPPQHLIEDSNALGGYRISSAAFDDSPDGTPMSGFWERLHQQMGLNENDALSGHENFSLASFKAKLARQLEQGIQHDPTEDAPAHVLVFGPKRKPIKRGLAAGAHWLVLNGP